MGTGGLLLFVFVALNTGLPRRCPAAPLHVGTSGRAGLPSGPDGFTILPFGQTEDIMTTTPTAALADFLDDRAAKVRAIEAEAEELIHGAKDQAGYQAKMRQKAELLSKIAEDGGALAAGLPSPLDAAAAERLERFAGSASTSLRVGSVFFMSALLYPEDYKPGQPNDLESFAAEVRGWA
jgi:hypothetical protein